MMRKLLSVLNMRNYVTELLFILVMLYKGVEAQRDNVFPMQNFGGHFLPPPSNPMHHGGFSSFNSPVKRFSLGQLSHESPFSSIGNDGIGYNCRYTYSNGPGAQGTKRECWGSSSSIPSPQFGSSQQQGWGSPSSIPSPQFGSSQQQGYSLEPTFTSIGSDGLEYKCRYTYSNGLGTQGRKRECWTSSSSNFPRLQFENSKQGMGGESPFTTMVEDGIEYKCRDTYSNSPDGTQSRSRKCWSSSTIPGQFGSSQQSWGSPSIIPFGSGQQGSISPSFHSPTLKFETNQPHYPEIQAVPPKIDVLFDDTDAEKVTPKTEIKVDKDTKPVFSEKNIDKSEDKPAASKISECELSLTTVNQKKVCRNTVIFSDHFQDFDNSKWTKEQFIPSYSTSNELMVFNYYNESNIDVVEGRLTVSPEIVPDQIVRGGHLKLEPCTGNIADECYRKAQFQWILPPVSSGRVSTRNTFAFKYGRVEVTAKVPVGDWLVPEIWLVPKNPVYGPGIESGRISMVMTRGNSELMDESGSDISFRIPESSLLMSSAGNIKSKIVRCKSNEPSHYDYNKYTFTWRPDEMALEVNGVIVGNLLFRNLTGSLAHLVGFSHDEERKWLKGSAIAPFDQEFYLSFGLSVGGREFPDNSVSGGYTKPWKTSSVKEMLDFWMAKDKWAPTWNKNFSQLKILKVEVKSL